jgi:hypothetical protein
MNKKIDKKTIDQLAMFITEDPDKFNSEYKDLEDADEFAVSRSDRDEYGDRDEDAGRDEQSGWTRPSNTIDIEEIGYVPEYPAVPVPLKRKTQQDKTQQDKTNPLDNIEDEYASDAIYHLEYELDWDHQPGEPSTYDYPGSPDYNELTDCKVTAINYEPLYAKNGPLAGLPRDGTNRPVRDGTIPAGIAEKHSIFDIVAVDFDELNTILHKYFKDYVEEKAQEGLNE